MSALTVAQEPGQIAPFRNPAVPQAGLPTGQGLVQAGVIQGGYVQYLNQNPAGTWSLAGLDGSNQYPAQAVVAVYAPQPQNPPEWGVNLFWSPPGSGQNLWSTYMPSADGWNPPSATSVPALTGLQVAYTPMGNPVVCGVDSSNNLWLYSWSNPNWTATSYSAGDMQWGALTPGFSVVFVDETDWWAFAASTTSDTLLAVAGTLGDGSGGSVTGTTTFGVPTAKSFKFIVGGAVSPSSAASNPSTPCVFYLDGGNNLMMWPSTLTGDAVVPVPDVDALPAGAGNMPPAVAVSNTPATNSFASLGAGGTATTIYQADSANNVYAIRQLAWVFDNQLPFFSPPTYIVGASVNEISVIGVVPDARPGDVPAVFVMNVFDEVWECELNGQLGTWNGTSQTGQWTATQINV